MTDHERELIAGALAMAHRYMERVAHAWDAGRARGVMPPGASLMSVDMALRVMRGEDVRALAQSQGRPFIDVYEQAADIGREHLKPREAA